MSEEIETGEVEKMEARLERWKAGQTAETAESGCEAWLIAVEERIITPSNGWIVQHGVSAIPGEPVTFTNAPQPPLHPSCPSSRP